MGADPVAITTTFAPTSLYTRSPALRDGEPPSVAGVVVGVDSVQQRTGGGPAFLGLVALVLFAGLTAGRGNILGAFALVTLGASLAGYSARGSMILGALGGGLIGTLLLALLLSGLGANDDAGVLVSVGFAALVALAYGAIGWYLGAETRSPAELAIGIAGAVVLAVPVALVGIVGLFALACEGGC